MHRIGRKGAKFSVLEASPTNNHVVVDVVDVTVPLAGIEMGAVVIKEVGRNKTNI